ncbi:MAG: hypothetical protein V4733_02255 [Verrucomicrobiota bacterium]
MTRSGFLLFRIGKALGYFRKAHRMADLAAETHLLRDAETHLGSRIWREVENIEALAVEYWNLRKLAKESARLEGELAACQEQLDSAHRERAAMLNEAPGNVREFQERRGSQIKLLENLARERDRVIHDARGIRREFVGQRTKLEVLMKENPATERHAQEVARIQQQLLDLRKRFDGLKNQRGMIANDINAGNELIQRIEQELAGHRGHRRGTAATALQTIGEGNKAFSNLKAQKSIIDAQMRQLFGEIGRYVSRHADDRTCARAFAAERNLVEVMRALRRSIQLNQRLVEPV